MKKLLLFGIVSILLLGNINSAKAGSWVPYTPGYTTNCTPAGSIIFDYSSMTIIFGPPTGGSGQITYITPPGSTKYRVSYTSIISSCGSGGLVLPDNTGVPPGTWVEWPSGNCFFAGGGVVWHGISSFVKIIGLKFEKWVN